MGSTVFRNPQSLSSALAAFGMLQLKALGFLNTVWCFTLEEYNGHFFTFCRISPRPYKYLIQVIYQNNLQGLLFNLIMIIYCHVTVICCGRASKIDGLEKTLGSKFL